MVKGKDFVADVKERRARGVWKNQSRERESNRLSVASKLDQGEGERGGAERGFERQQL